MVILVIVTTAAYITGKKGAEIYAHSFIPLRVQEKACEREEGKEGEKLSPTVLCFTTLSCSPHSRLLSIKVPLGNVPNQFGDDSPSNSTVKLTKYIS